MPTQNPVQNSRAHRWAYACGMSVTRGYRKLRVFESRLAERAVTAGMPAGKLLVRGSFLIAKLALIGGLLFVGFWALLSLMTLMVLYWVIAHRRLNDSKDFYGAQAFGDPYGEYELNRAPGQPDLDEH
ncbi:Protein of unknown function [Pseudomonas synxantha]|uniref:DUF3742 family protein n=1 Tax=Pseudomonas synxantha TaxID=47883 RepID=A0AAX3I9B8_9PSED|nr:DUF3742 family protein [Pseudomonas synxantha]KRP53569.1 hypothetical protein TU77_16090 [Pseudomonas synxantha]SDU43664.1 Protein of unknown function [Pseudomonas synxantha]VTR02117.1 Uncharacterised protein [Pseudomonas synxantha]